jgi:hypothetical protein
MVSEGHGNATAQAKGERIGAGLLRLLGARHRGLAARSAGQICEGAYERAGVRIARGEACCKVRDAPPNRVDRMARQLLPRAERRLGAIAEEGSTAKGPRGIDAAAPVFRQERARALIGHWKSAPLPSGDSRGAHGVADLLELNGRRMRLPPGQRKLTASRLRRLWPRTIAGPADEQIVDLCVQGAQIAS